MDGLERRTFFLSTEVGDSRVVIGPWEIGVPKAALFFENRSSESAQVNITMSNAYRGEYSVGEGMPPSVQLIPGGRDVVILGRWIVGGTLIKFLGVNLESALNTGFVKVDMVGFCPLPECQMATPPVGELNSWWSGPPES